MSCLRFAGRLGRSWSRKRTRRTPVTKRFTRPLTFLCLEDRRLLTSILGSADSFAVLGASTVTNTGPTTLTGDLGLYSGPSITGFAIPPANTVVEGPGSTGLIDGPGLVTGTIYLSHAVAQLAQTDVTTAYHGLAAMPVTSNLTGQDLGGLTLTSGVYHFDSSAQLTGTLTLDAQGNNQAFWVFQVGSTLTTASSSSVAVTNLGSNGGSDDGVFWQIGSSATLGTGTSFVGNILASASISLTTATILNGRALAQTGAVTLNTNTISNVCPIGGPGYSGGLEFDTNGDVVPIPLSASSVSGIKFHDLNANGLKDAGEPGLSGWTVYVDVNNDGVYQNATEPSAETASDGTYTILGIAPGSWRVREVGQSGWTNSFPATADAYGRYQSVILLSSGSLSGVDFGNWTPGSLSGINFHDLNADGLQDAGEPGLSGWTVYVDVNNDGVFQSATEPSAVTASDGTYTILGIAPGSWRVREVGQSGWTNSLPATADAYGRYQSVILPSSGALSGLDFGNWAPIRISNDHDPSLVFMGVWTAMDCAGNYLNDVTYASPGNGSTQAIWSFNVAPGVYRVSTTWMTLPTSPRASNAPFTVYGSNGETPVTLRLDQTSTPEQLQTHVFDQGFYWSDCALGFRVTGSILYVKLTNDANNYVVADAIRIEQVVSPEIVVHDATADIVDGVSTVTLGSTPQNTPLYKTFTVVNTGGSDLTLTTPISVPTGFSVVNSFGVTTLAAGQSTTFTLRFDASTPGTSSGQISFGNNDSDENPFSFTLTGEATGRIVDNGDAGYTTAGTWTNWTTSGYGTDAQYAAAGTGSNLATWSFTGLTAGQTYQVSATWLPHANRANNAPYSVYNGAVAGGNLVFTVPVNQQLAPSDFTAAGVGWKQLAIVMVSGTTLSVQLTNHANGYVLADAIELRTTAAPAAAPEIAVNVGGSNLPDGTGSVVFGSTPTGTAVVKTFTVQNTGTAVLTLGTLTVPAGFTAAAFGTTMVPAGASTTFSVTLTAASVGSYSGTVSFGNNDSDENPFDFTLTGEATGRIIDNGDAGYTTAGAWTNWTTSGYGTDAQYAAAGTGSSLATWSFTGLTAGQNYQVSATWLPHTNRATNAPYSLYNGAVAGGNLVSKVPVNQQLVPSDFSAAGVSWKQLAIVTVSGTSLSVQLTNNANGYALADAIELRTSAAPAAAPEIAVSMGGSNLPDGAGSVVFGSTPTGTAVVKTFTVQNTGTAVLTLGTLTVPTGFTASAFGTTTVAAGAATTFSVTLSAASAGSYSGTLSVGNNDSDENPFDFTVSGTVTAMAVSPQIIDDGDTGFVTTGSWVLYTQGGRGNDLRYAAAGSGSNVASWSFPITTAGNYRISATWLLNANRATNSPYSVYNGAATGTPLQTVLMNQQLAPSGFTDSGSTWRDLGVFTITASTLAVKLTNAANGYVIADAIRIEYVSPLLAAEGAGQVTVPAADLTPQQVESTLALAVQRWTASGLTVVDQQTLQTVTAGGFDLPGRMLGGATSVGLLIDRDAAGDGWFVESAVGGEPSSFLPRASSFDLLTVLEHELGHLLGLAHTDAQSPPDDLMAATLLAGVRRLPQGGGASRTPPVVPVAERPGAWPQADRAWERLFELDEPIRRSELPSLEGAESVDVWSPLRGSRTESQRSRSLALAAYRSTAVKLDEDGDALLDEVAGDAAQQVQSGDFHDAIWAEWSDRV